MIKLSPQGHSELTGGKGSAHPVQQVSDAHFHRDQGHWLRAEGSESGLDITGTASSEGH